MTMHRTFQKLIMVKLKDNNVMSFYNSWPTSKRFMLVDPTNLTLFILTLMVRLELENHSSSGASLMLSRISLKMNCKDVILWFGLHILELLPLEFVAGQTNNVL